VELGNGFCLNGRRDPDFVPRLYRNEAKKPGFGQMCIFISAQVTKKKKKLENRPHRSFMAEVMQRLDDILRQVNSFSVSHKRMHQMK
jgi:hypothetical protein